jgi:hypothetical protein
MTSGVIQRQLLAVYDLPGGGAKRPLEGQAGIDGERVAGVARSARDADAPATGESHEESRGEGGE